MDERLYEVTERLAGSCTYEIWAPSAREAREKLRRGEHGEMISHKVEHTGQAQVRRVDRAASPNKRKDADA